MLLDGRWTPSDKRDLESVIGAGALFPREKKLIPECKIARISFSLVCWQKCSMNRSDLVLHEIN